MLMTATALCSWRKTSPHVLRHVITRRMPSKQSELPELKKRQPDKPQLNVTVISRTFPSARCRSGITTLTSGYVRQSNVRRGEEENESQGHAFENQHMEAGDCIVWQFFRAFLISRRFRGEFRMQFPFRMHDDEAAR